LRVSDGDVVVFDVSFSPMKSRGPIDDDEKFRKPLGILALPVFRSWQRI